MFRINLKALRENKGLSQAEFAKQIGVSQSTVGMWESGKREPNLDTFNMLADFFNITLDQLYGISNLRPVSEAIRAGRIIDVLGKVPAGTPVEAVEFIVGQVELSAEMSKNGKDYFALMVVGDSMFPKYEDGDTVIVEKCSYAKTNDDVVAYINSCDATLKRIALSDNGITLRALNPAYETKSYSNEEVKSLPVEILGVVVEQRRNK